MNFHIFPVILATLLCTTAASAQSGSFIVGIDHFQKTNRLFHYLLSDKSLGLKLGYNQSFDNEAWSIDLTAFANYLDDDFDIAPDRYFTGGTLYTGLGLAPRYCFNPDAKFRFSVSVMLKGQYAFGQGDVFRRQPAESSDTGDESLERKFVKAGFGLGFSPLVSVKYPVSLGTIGLEAGWDSSDAGKGVNALRSAYYRPISYHSSAFFVGLVFRIRP